MLRTVSKNKTVLLRNAKIGNEVRDVFVRNGKIERIDGNISSPADMTIDVAGHTLRPGLVDIHSHGCMGEDSSDGAEAQRRMARYYAEHGTTSWYPTGMTLPVSRLRSAFAKIPETPDGANIPGYHAEGPYINEKHRGAQNPEYIRRATIGDFEDLGTVKLITLAPETEGAIDYIQKTNILCVVGHTDADYDTALKAFRAGARCVTHLFNAMPPLHHRAPAVLGAAFDGDAYVQLISDGLHIHPSVVRMTYRLFGAERMILISDSVRPAFLADGHYECGGMVVTVKNGEARLDENGALAGSTSSLLRCVQQAIRFGIPEDDAFRMASETPAKMMGLQKGKLEPNYDAEFLILDEQNELLDVLILNK